MHRARAGIQHDPVDLDGAAVDGALRPAQDGFDPCEQLARVEGLAKVVVGAELEAEDAVDIFVACGQHQDWYAAGLPHLLQDFEAVDAGQHDIENDQVVAALLRFFESMAAIVDTLDVVVFSLQVFLEQRA